MSPSPTKKNGPAESKGGVKKAVKEIVSKVAPSKKKTTVAEPGRKMSAKKAAPAKQPSPVATKTTGANKATKQAVKKAESTPRKVAKSEAMARKTIPDKPGPSGRGVSETAKKASATGKTAPTDKSPMKATKNAGAKTSKAAKKK
jgi:hypothetical protein